MATKESVYRYYVDEACVTFAEGDDSRRQALMNERKYCTINGQVYFCFINSMEYNSQYRTNINFEVDVIQSFMFEFTIDKSFIERKVCSIDEISDFDEGLNIGEHIIESDTDYGYAFLIY